MTSISSRKQIKPDQSGFTLIEMVTVIVILGVLSVGLSSFIRFGTQVYVDTTIHDHLISSGRFAVERLNREVRHALPNSPNVSGGCLEFYPVVAAARYVDIPVAPESSSAQITVRPFDDSGFSDAVEAAVYTVNTDDVYVSNDHIRDLNTAVAIDKSNANEWVVTLASSGLFAADSPTERLYFIDDLIRFCISGSTLTRQEGAGTPITMAENLDGSSTFNVTAATQTRNGIVEVALVFSALGETFNFENIIQVPNVP